MAASEKMRVKKTRTDQLKNSKTHSLDILTVYRSALSEVGISSGGEVRQKPRQTSVGEDDLAPQRHVSQALCEVEREVGYEITLGSLQVFRAPQVGGRMLGED